MRGGYSDRPWPIQPRDELLGRALHAFSFGGDIRGVVLIGNAGTGKSTVAAGIARASRLPALNLTPALVNPLEPYGALAPLLLESPDGSILARAFAALERASATGSTLLRVDDAQLLDSESASIVAQLVASGRMLLLATAPSLASLSPALSSLVRNGRLETLTVGSFNRQEAGQLLGQVFGMPVDGSAVKRLWRASAGNIGLLRLMVIDGLVAGVFEDSDRVVHLTTSRLFGELTRQHVALELDRLAHDDRMAAETIAATEPVPAYRLSGLVATAAIDRLIHSGLVTTSIDPAMPALSLLRLAQPVVGEVIRETLGFEVLETTHTAVLSQLSAPTERTTLGGLRTVGWAIATAHSVEARVAIDAAVTANRLHDYELAIQLCTALIDGELEFTDRIVLLRERAFARRFSGDAAAAMSDLSAARDELGEHSDPRLLAGIASSIADLHHYASDDTDAALAVIDEAILSLPYSDSRSRDAHERLVAERVMHLNYGGRFLESVQAFREARFADPAVRGRVTAAAASSLTQLGRPRTAFRTVLGSYVERQLRFGRSTWVIEELDAAAFVSVYHSAGPATARKYAGRTLSEHDESAHFLRFDDGLSLSAIAALAISSGDMQEALASAESAIAALDEHDPSGFGAHAAALAAEAYALSGNAELAAQWISRSRALPLRTSAALWPDTVHSLLTASVGTRPRDETVLELTEVADRMHEQSVFGGEARVLHLGVRLGERACAERLIELEPELDGALYSVLVLHARAFLAADARALLKTSGRFDRLGFMQIAAETAIAAAETAAAQGLVRLADEARRRATAFLATMPALRSPLIHGPSVSGTDPTVLTRREREVAALVARGASNREIADALHLSVRTVEGHLARLYPKLGITSRRQLEQLS